MSYVDSIRNIRFISDMNCGLGREGGIGEGMSNVFLDLYSNADLGRMFFRETGEDVDGDIVKHFRRWVGGPDVSSGRRLLYDFHLWLIYKIHKYLGLKRPLH